MRSFALECWDEGHLTVNGEFTEILRANKLTTFDSLMQFSGGCVAKNLLHERTTTQIELAGRDGARRAFFLKRHLPAPWKEYVKPLLRLARPILGARNEWNAILQFHKVGIETMIPVALGARGRYSFLLTESIVGCHKLSQWMENDRRPRDTSEDRLTASMVHRVAEVARTMHAAGLHHQDFYLTHLMVPDEDPCRTLYVIDLGRVCQRKRLSRRWIVKDLAQLNYSARSLSRKDRIRFLEGYLGRALRDSDHPFVRRIERKTEAIARHSRKHRL